MHKIRKYSSKKVDLHRENHIKNSLTQAIGQSVKALQNEYVGSDEDIKSNDTTNTICSLIEAVFIHGLRETFFEKVSIFLTTSPDRMPEPNFWPLLMVFTHKNVITQINQLRQIHNDIGRARAWIRIAINENLIGSYLSSIVSDTKTLRYYYHNHGYLADSEHVQIILNLLQGMEAFQFQLAFNSHVLNSWVPSPLMFAGIWSPSIAPEAVVLGVDVASYFGEEEAAKIVTKERSVPKAPREQIASSVLQPKTQDSATQHSSSEPLDKFSFERDKEEDFDLSNTPSSCPDPCPPELSQGDQADMEREIFDHFTLSGSNEEEEINDNPTPVPPEEVTTEPQQGSEEKETEPQQVQEEEVTPGRSRGNSLIGKEAWSCYSPEDLDEDSDEICRALSKATLDNRAPKSGNVSESYQRLLNNYTSSATASPDLKSMAFPSSNSSLQDQGWEPRELDEGSPRDLGFEVVPYSCLVLSSNADERTQGLVSLLTVITNEKGLDFQNYQCKGCSRPVGMIYGKARVCCYDSCYYCYECHENEESAIPSRILHNWDFRPYKVARFTKEFLDKIAAEPMLDISAVNANLYNVVPPLEQIRLLRIQLGYLRSYLFTCRENVAEELRKRMWPKEYLSENHHFYAINDLYQVPTGHLASSLNKWISFATKHVLECGLCCQKGFVCEICNNPQVIYPFQMDTTSQCDKCMAVYHAPCRSSVEACPKCERRSKRMEQQQDFFWPNNS